MSSSRLSYASSPESDLELSPGPPTSLSLGNLPQLVKSSSDPSIATNQDNLERDREILGEGLPPPYTQQFDAQNNRNSKYLDTNGRPQSIYGIHAPDLPPRIDRQSKPSGTPSRTSSSGGTLGRSAQERLFGKSTSIEANDHEEYVTRNPNTDSIERRQMMAPPAQNSLDRARALANAGYPNSPSKNGAIPGQNGSYDSVSSYDSYNNSQNMRLGPNAPDDLKSVPNGRIPPATNPDYRAVHHSRAFSGSNDLNRQNSPGRPQYDVNGPRNIDPRQRPSNLMLEGSPRKPLMETKTDYGKFRNNSSSTADYTKVPKHGVLPIPNVNVNGNGNTPPMNGNMPFKPVPPPKPKNYRPPVQGQWENGDPSSPTSPNGFYYPPTPSHYHHSQANVSNGNGIGPSHHGPPIHAYGSPHQQHGYPTNGYNGNGPNGYNGNPQYIQRGPHPVANLQQDRHGLDLAGSREQRGSAFELYRKPQIGATGHHHNMSNMEPLYGNYYNTQPRHQMYSQQQANHDPNYAHFYASQGQGPPPLPMKNTFPKVKKKSGIKSQLTAIKNALIKTAKPLRRMNSMVEPERKLKPILKRQHSMMEKRIQYPDDYHTYPRQEPMPYPNMPYQRNVNEQYYPHPHASHGQDLNSTYTNLESNDIYGSTDRYASNLPADDIYSNRASIDLERQKQSGRRIVRRHSLADRTGARRQQYIQQQEDIYQSRQGAYMMEPRRMAPNSEVMQRRRFYPESEPQSPITDEPVYTSRKEMMRSHLYQSRKEMQDRIATGTREFSPHASSSQSSGGDDRSDKENSSRSDKEIYKSRREMRQLREQIYQTRRDAMESMAEPTYVSKRELTGRPEPIYESKEERANEADESRLPSSSAEETFSNSKHSNDTMVENTLIPRKPDDAMQLPPPPIQTVTSAVVHESPVDENPSDHDDTTNVEEEDDEEEDEAVGPLPLPPNRPSPFHISNMIKRTAPPPAHPPMAASRTSLETQYTSQASLGVGPPNATSTPYASDLSLPLAPPALQNKMPPIRDTITTTGIFDEKGGTLCDNVWNVSLVIPPGAIPPGLKQEIYFTVSDPRLGQAAAGAPPLDMENGETMLSPLVMCGPQGLEFGVPVTLNIPHCAGKTPSLGLALKATDSERNLHTEWDNIDLPSNNAAHTVSVKVDHF